MRRFVTLKKKRTYRAGISIKNFFPQATSRAIVRPSFARLSDFRVPKSRGDRRLLPRYARSCSVLAAETTIITIGAIVPAIIYRVRCSSRKRLQHAAATRIVTFARRTVAIPYNTGREYSLARPDTLSQSELIVRRAGIF